jgi:hypothetical protein
VFDFRRLGSCLIGGNFVHSVVDALWQRVGRIAGELGQLDGGGFTFGRDACRFFQ